MQLSPHFTLDEMTVSEWAGRNGVRNNPGSGTLPTLRATAELLEQVRSLVGGPIVITSGYRSEEVNTGIGGAVGSAHITGRAADINRPGMTARELATRIVKSGIKFDMCIFEYDSWVHIQIAKPGSTPRREVWTIRKGTGYMVGIV